MAAECTIVKFPRAVEAPDIYYMGSGDDDDICRSVLSRGNLVTLGPFIQVQQICQCQNVCQSQGQNE